MMAGWLKKKEGEETEEEKAKKLYAKMGKLIKKEVEKAEIMNMDEDKLMDVAKAAGETSDVKDFYDEIFVK